MKTNFQKNGVIVLSTKEPAGFLNFVYDGSSYKIIPRKIDVSTGVISINGIDISEDSSIYNEEDPNYFLKIDSDVQNASLFIRTTSLSDFDKNLKIDIYDSSLNGIIETIDVSVLNRVYSSDQKNVNNYIATNVLVDGDTSYMLLRSNPLFGGNIKVVVDSENKLYMDTYKVSDVLSNKLYRKQQISANSNFSGDVRRIFSTLPLGEMYKISSEDVLDISLPETELNKQYITDYSYGGRLLKDDLYDEDYAMHAPLWLNNKLPDYFAIFRLPGAYNPETYGEGEIADLALKYIKNGKLIKSWGIKENTPVGTYLRNHLDEMVTVNVAPIFLSLSDPSLTNPDPNTWYGVSPTAGIIAGKSETTYNFDEKSSNFTDMNAFTSKGFERQNVLMTNLMNMEYVFSDDDASLYTMSRYFGLYLTENILYDVAYYQSSIDSSVYVLSADNKNSSDFFNSDMFDTSGNIIDEFSNRIITIDDINEINRIDNVNQLNGVDNEIIKPWINKLGDVLLNESLDKLDHPGKFISIELNNLLKPGETFRFNNLDDSIIWEIYGTGDDHINNGGFVNYPSKSEASGHPTVNRVAFSTKGDISDQVNAMWGAWGVLMEMNDVPISHYYKKENGYSIKIRDNFKESNIQFQRITSNSSNDLYNNTLDYGFNSSGAFDDVIFYGALKPTIDDFEIVPIDSSYGPIDFEIFGDRMSITVDIIDISNLNAYTIGDEKINMLEEHMLYMDTDRQHKLVSYIDAQTAIARKLRYIDHPLKEGKSLLLSETEVFPVANTWNVYKIYSLSISLMGINPVKDFDFTIYDSSVLDTKSSYWYNRENDISTNYFTINPSDNELQRTINTVDSFEIIKGKGDISIGGISYEYDIDGSLNSFNTFNSVAVISPEAGETIISRFKSDASVEFNGYDPSISEENLYDYYESWDDQTAQFKLKYTTTVPTVTKWVGVGTDCRNNPLRLVLNENMFAPGVSTNFIPSVYNFTDELFYPSFKYLDTGKRNWKDYVYFDINDPIKHTIDGKTEYSTFKELLTINPKVDIFSKLVYYNNNVTGTETRSTITHYNSYTNSIDSIISGMSLSMEVTDTALNVLDTRDWDGFRLSAITVSSRNKTSNKQIEVYINEHVKTILIVWYQGNDILNYNTRVSPTQMGKNVLDPDIINSSSYLNNINLKSFNHDVSSYSHIKTPFGVNNSSISTDILKIYGIEPNYEGKSYMAEQFNQFNQNYNTETSDIFNAYGKIDIIGNQFEFYNESYNTFNDNIQYNYNISASSYGKNVVNHPYTYNNNINLYLNNTCDLTTFEYLTSNNLVEYFISKNGKTLINDDFVSEPIKIIINKPKEYKNVSTFHGWYKPSFNNILEFNYNEPELVTTALELDFILGNTDLKSYNNIPQLWYNKVVSTVTQFDVSVGNAIDHVKNYNPFISQWDDNYYYKYDDNVKTSIPGYNSAIESPSFFGSKLVKLPNEITLDKWSDATAYIGRVFKKGSRMYSNAASGNYVIQKNEIQLVYALSKSLIGIFKNNPVFVDNWRNLTESDNIINGYIKKTVLDYYDISKSKMNVTVWEKDLISSDNELENRIAYEWDDEFTKLEGSNIDSELIYRNGEFVYKFNVDTYPLKQYFVEVDLFEK